MVHVVAHFLIPVFLLELYRKFIDKKFSIHYVFIGGLAGILADLDIVAYYFLSFFGYGLREIHRTFSHNVWIVSGFLLIGILFYIFYNKSLGSSNLKVSTIFFVISLGISIHLILDIIVEDVVMLFYPFSNFAVGFHLINLFPEDWRELILPSIDAGLLILWIIYIWHNKKIKEFF